MNALALQSFGFEGQTVRALDQDGAPWFVAQDVCAVLEISKHRDAVAKLDDDERASTVVDTLGGPQQMAIVSESGLYALIFKSRKPAAVRFRKWVTSEVLPTLRRTGRYLLAENDDEEDDPLGLTAPDDFERMRVKLTLVREARYVYGRKTARTVWEKVGLPDVYSQRALAAGSYSPDDLNPAIARWLAERTVANPGARTEATALYEDYAEWCGEQGEEPWLQTPFGKQLTRHGFRAHKSGRVHRLGICLKD